jgi:hypothetical protein
MPFRFCDELTELIWIITYNRQYSIFQSDVFILNLNYSKCSYGISTKNKQETIKGFYRFG